MELIVSIAILSILTSMLLAIVNPAEQFAKAQDSKRKTDLSQIQRGLEAYYQDFNRYPKASEGKISMDGTKTGEVNWGSGGFTPYMSVLPIDSNSSKNYYYWVDEVGNGQSYRLYASLDRGSRDIGSCNNGAACTGVSTATCGGVCNFGVSSPNVSP